MRWIMISSTIGESCSHLTHFIIESSKIEANILEHLKGMALTSVSFIVAIIFTDKALEHL